jgi:hypothetical protein
LAHPLFFCMYIIHTTIKIIGFDTYFPWSNPGNFVLVTQCIENKKKSRITVRLSFFILLPEGSVLSGIL